MTRTPAEIAAEAMEAFAHDGPLCDDYNLALAQVALSALEREGYVIALAAELEALRANLGEAWSALALIREAVETLGPVGAMQSREHLSGPTFTDEAEAIVEGVRKMAGPGWQPIETAPKDGTAILIFQPDGHNGRLNACEMPRDFEGGFYRGDDPRLIFYDDLRFSVGYWRPRGGWGNRNCASVTPTHWMPLSARPQDGGGA